MTPAYRVLMDLDALASLPRSGKRRATVLAMLAGLCPAAHPAHVTIHLSIKFRNDSTFWITLFHEIAHLLTGRRVHRQAAK